MNMKQKKKNWTKDNIELQHKLYIVQLRLPAA